MADSTTSMTTFRGCSRIHEEDGHTRSSRAGFHHLLNSKEYTYHTAVLVSRATREEPLELDAAHEATGDPHDLARDR
jgi:hypothetical protein